MSFISLIKKSLIASFLLLSIFFVSCGPFGLSDVIRDNNVKWSSTDGSFYFIDIEVPRIASSNGYGEYVIDGKNYQIYASGDGNRPYLYVFVYDDYDCLGYLKFIMNVIWSRRKLNKDTLILELQTNSTNLIVSNEKFSICKTRIQEDNINPIEFLLTSYEIDHQSFVSKTDGRNMDLFRLIENYFYGVHFFNYLEDEVEIPVYLRWEPNNKGVFYSSFVEETGELSNKIAEYDYVILNSTQIQLNRVDGSLPESLLLTANRCKT